MTEELQEQTELLLNKKNVILQGAPGTGKTYSTAILALSIIGVDDVNYKDHDDVMSKYNEFVDEGQIRFVTFHQSMDYEDFVEGYKPIEGDNYLNYHLEDGIFKQICNMAKKNYERHILNDESIQKEKLKRVIDKFLNCAIDSQDDFQTKQHTHFKIKDINENGNIIILIPENEKTQTLTVYYNDLFKILKSKVELKNVNEISNILGRSWFGYADSFLYVLCQKIREKFQNELEKVQEKSEEVQKEPLKNYVLIIDEINRGNVSKVFGELITLLEADKRMGGKHPIKLELSYSKSGSGEREKMEIPPNLYIIGTMNTTDRSVGSIDYAVRRRFSFITLESKREVVEEKSSNQALKLFDAVKKFIKDNTVELDMKDLMIGHSYFLDDKDEKKLSMKWKYDIRPLLNEYYKDGLLKENVPIKENDQTKEDEYLNVDEFIAFEKINNN